VPSRPRPHQPRGAVLGHAGKTMTVFRHYKMNALVGHGDILRKVLVDLVAQIRPVPGCLGIEVFRDPAIAENFILIEKWASVEAHKKSHEFLPGDCLSPLKDVLRQKPEGIYLSPCISC
jgi:quinol monooxygenase YgiN